MTILSRRRHTPNFIFKALLMIILLMPALAIGQFYNGYQMEFGRSRVQFNDFLWSYYRFERFDTYFYLNGKELAVHTAKYADLQLAEMEDELDTYLEGQIQFIIFNNLNDLKQSNIGLTTNTEYNTGGISHILGNKVILYFDGSMVNFERQIRQGIAHVLLQNAIFGTNIGTQVMNSFLQNFPEWYTLGLIAYLAEDWNTDIDHRIRDAISSGRYKKFNRMVMDENLVKDAGHSFWRFLAQEYGQSQIVNIINMTRVSRSIETGFMYVLGLDLKVLYKQWLDFYKHDYEASIADREMPPDDMRLKGKRVLKRNDLKRKYSELQIDPTGNSAAFVSNEIGKYKVWIHNLNNSKLTKIYTGGYKLNEKIDYSYPILTWHPSGKILSMILEKKGLIWLYFYDIENENLTSQNLFGYDKILDMTYTPDGRSLLLSAVQKGQNDIFLFTISSGSFQQITNDIFDDMSPRFLEPGKIIFSSNRPGDTLVWGQMAKTGTLPTTYDLFLYDYGKRSPFLRRLTQTPLANEKQAQPYMDGYFSYLSDENGIYNQYLGKPDSTIAYVDTAIHYRYFTHSFPITNYPANIDELHISPASEYQSWIISHKLYDQLYFEPLPYPEDLEPVNLDKTSYMKSLIAGARAPDAISPSRPDQNEQEVIIPKLSEKRKSFKNVIRDKSYKTETEINGTAESGNIDIDNYQIDTQDGPLTIGGKPQADTGQAVEEEDDEFVIPKQRIYYTQYSINKLVTQIDFSYLSQMYQSMPGAVQSEDGGDIPGLDLTPDYTDPGLSPTFMAGITDLMENYRMMGGLRIGLDLVNKEYFFNFANMSKRMDKEYIFQRRTLEQPFFAAYVTRQKINEGFFVLTYPFTRVLRLRGTFLFRNENYIFAGPDEFSIRYPIQVQNWGGAKLQLIYDDTKELGMNLYEGMRFMVFGEYNQRVEYLDRNLMVVGFDIRKYIRIHRQFIWANRLAASTNFGSERLLYFMGGTDSWMLPSFDQDTRIDPDQNWTYRALATNMRGFNQNARNGNNFVVFNSEFRLPLFKYLFNKPMSSEFLKSFQVVAFGDIGTAWSGWNPYDEDNVLYTRYEESGPLRIKVQYQKDPIIGGLGFGARAKVLGYFLKGDLAWGIEDGKVKKKPIFYLSMSLDF